ncbi:indole-3-glycerol-phosphate synthase [Snodgrassella communis]|uniref:Indole-3-glycerol phosphate synthase n=1 Tax=Snodgrassella communis TaxID=2946699 RepID=A0A066TJC9_9NEIS|nr:indole-3-glycerol phosphate synthase TrpC [Snodgrassella communis]KDN12892.1 Indole-3-glycerol phosphate synthase [Snodgrassella communis]KDN15201.1 Indole-3-glycerol phosphate synthase [Snodgrassella communis]PIT10347.1 indole-3-glycerol-phosphate synthase [Snodgrassella communis]PIT26821.1 indole-3-glycerol-phosphate synthase [Snodgrassella communis]PIT29760.1 indole-3-glycerol-phosphate synthase [Snodgrassella communis]
MSDILNKIIATKKKEVAAAKNTESMAEVRARAYNQVPVRPFLDAIHTKHQQGKAAIIAEVKKASPSKGLIRPDFSPADIARSYQKGGAACMSVLTDVSYFQGSLTYLNTARNACNLPVLRKDFIIDIYQVYQSRAHNADAILLIAAALSQTQLNEYEAIAHELGMTVLLEIHNEEELEKCINMRTQLWGVNNRNLRNFEVDLQQTIKLLPLLTGKTVVTESGIFTTDDIHLMQQHQVNTFLIGESLMCKQNIADELNILVNA